MSGSEQRIPIPDLGASPREADGHCARCGVVGTIARTLPAVTSNDEEAGVERYCAACWPTARADLDARGRAWTSRAWSDVQDFLALIATTAPNDPHRTPATYAALSAELLAMADDMDGPMPAEVASFLRQYDAPAV